ncbi:MAG: hypothetical protein ACRDGA_09485, partial [Bacteroidota bacterium]
PIVWLIILIRKRQIVFAITLDDLASIKDDGENAILLRASNGSEYRMVFSSLFPKKERERWTQAIKKAVLKAGPGIQTREVEGVIEFVQ